MRRHVLLFCAVGLAIAIAVDATLWTGLRRLRRKRVFAVWDQLLAGRINSDVLVVGGSVALVGVDCDVLSARLGGSCFNIGLDGSPANLQRPYVETYLAHNRRPRVAVVNVDMATSGELKTPYDLAQYLPYLREKPIAESLNRYVDVWKFRYVPLYTFTYLGLNETMNAIRGLAVRDVADVDRVALHGFRPEDLPWDGTFEAYRADHPDGVVIPESGAGMDEFVRMIAMLRSRGTRVVLTASPEWAGGQWMERNRASLMRTYATIAREANAPLLDYSGSELARDKSLFYNSQHLNRRGAALFTRMLANDLCQTGLNCNASAR
jgi:hypothetical protein